MADVNTTKITLTESQAINGVNAQGQAVGIALPDEAGQASNIRRNPETGGLYDATGLPAVAVVPDVKPGVGAQDDTGSTRAATTLQVVNPQTNQKYSIVQPQPNILDQYSSYTYSLSWFLLDPTVLKTQINPTTFSSSAQFKMMVLQNAQLLVRSGGIPKNVPFDAGNLVNPVSIQPNTKFTANPNFDVDFYIDNLEVESRIWGKGGSNLPHNIIKMRFTVTEPYGITLVQRLYNAVQSLYTQKGIIPKSIEANYAAAHYALLISFYGYDSAGNLVRAQNNTVNTNDSARKIYDSSAVVEKLYPFMITSIEYKVANKLTEYNISGAPIPYYINASQVRNTIPFGVNLTGQTLQEVLVGTSQSSSTTQPADGRTNTPIPSAGDIPNDVA